MTVIISELVPVMQGLENGKEAAQRMLEKLLETRQEDGPTEQTDDDNDDDDSVFHRGQISLFDRGSILASGLNLPISRIIGYFWMGLLASLDGSLVLWLFT